MGFDVTRIPEELYGYNCKNTRNYFSTHFSQRSCDPLVVSQGLSNDSELGFYNIHDYN